VEREKKPEVVRWVAEQNNLIQSLAAFDNVPAPLQDKAAYSKGLALAQLLGYGRDVSLWRRSAQLQADAVATLEAFVAEYPTSPLAPDALLSLGFIQRDNAYFQRLLREYPTSNAAVTARMQLAPR
jgi:outer membrane protein assembly factor BamD (BamD/ComL family)